MDCRAASAASDRSNARDRKRVVVPVLGMWLLLSAGGCGCGSSHLGYFRAAPLRYCASSKPIEVAWFTDAKSVNVTATPPVPELADAHQAPVGTLRIAPRATSLQLDFGPKDNRPTKQIAPLTAADSALQKGGFVEGCVGGALVVPFDIDPELYAPEVIVTALANPLETEITIEHAGGSWTIAPGARLSLRPLPGAADDPSHHLAHTWTIRAPLPGGCADTTPRPDKLGVTMTLECSP